MSKFNYQSVNGFLHTDGRKMRNGKGEEVILRGWGAGNWTNPEGFMVAGPLTRGGITQNGYQEPVKFDRGRSMDAAIRELCGNQYADRFWPRWYRNHLGEADIKAMAELGYNSVRLPLSARVFLLEEPGYQFNEDSFAMLDDIIGWCEKYGIYAIIDMHGAVAGQSGLPCDDGVDNQPHILIDEESAERTIVLWEEICRRYQNRFGVGGYDLLNEPISPASQHSYVPKLREFYEKLIARIRKIDKNHMLTIEGSAFSADNTVFFGEPFDKEVNNWCIHIHQYRFSPEARDLFKYLERSVALNVPIWIGEGKSSNEDMAIYYNICADFDIGFNLWCWKTAGPDLENNEKPRAGAPCSYSLPEGWHAIREYISNGGPKPSYEKCIQIFDQLLENLKYENCAHDLDVHNYCQRRPNITLPAVGYNHKPGLGVSFSGGWEFGNAFSYRTEDTTKLVLAPGKCGPFTGPAAQMMGRIMPGAPSPIPETSPTSDLLLELSDGGFAEYNIREVKDGCTLTLSLIPVRESKIQISCGKEILHTLSVSASETYQSLPCGAIPSGDDQCIRVTALEGTIRVKDLTFTQ